MYCAEIWATGCFTQEWRFVYALLLKPKKLGYMRLDNYVFTILCIPVKHFGNLFPYTLLSLVLLQKLRNHILSLVSASFLQNL